MFFNISTCKLAVLLAFILENADSVTVSQDSNVSSATVERQSLRSLPTPLEGRQTVPGPLFEPRADATNEAKNDFLPDSLTMELHSLPIFIKPPHHFEHNIGVQLSAGVDKHYKPIPLLPKAELYKDLSNDLHNSVNLFLKAEHRHQHPVLAKVANVAGILGELRHIRKDRLTELPVKGAGVLAKIVKVAKLPGKALKKLFVPVVKPSYAVTEDHHGDGLTHYANAAFGVETSKPNFFQKLFVPSIFNHRRGFFAEFSSSISKDHNYH